MNSAPRIPKLLTLLLVLLLCSGCALSGSSVSKRTSFPDNRTHLINEMPFYADDRYWCGPASLAGVLGYWNQPVSPKTIAGEIYSPNAKGTLPSDLQWFASNQGFDATIHQSDPEELKEWIQEDIPVIALVEYQNVWGSSPHFMVIVGYTPETVIVNSGLHEHQRIRWNRFNALWSRTDRVMVVIQPKEQPHPKNSANLNIQPANGMG